MPHEEAEGKDLTRRREAREVWRHGVVRICTAEDAEAKGDEEATDTQLASAFGNRGSPGRRVGIEAPRCSSLLFGIDPSDHE